MFSSQGNDELLVDEDQTYQDLMIWQQDGHTQVDAGRGTTNPSTTISRRTAKKPPQSSASGSRHGGVEVDDNSKKILHREIERQRRQEMAALYASLRTLLPLECIKGKRSVSDHMDGAVSYIKQLEKRITDLRATRDELERSSSRSGSGPSVLGQENATNMESSSSSSSATCSVSVRPCSGGIEILCNSGFREDGLMTLSRMLQVIHDEGLAVISCVSTQVDQRFLHTINTEVYDPTCLDLSGLQQKLIMALAP